MVGSRGFHKPNHTVFVSLSLNRVIYRCRGDELAPFCWPMPDTYVSVSSAFHPFVDSTVMISPVFKNKTGCRPTNNHRNLLLVNFRLRELPWSLSAV